MEDHMINAQINHSIETIEIDPEMDLSMIRVGRGETMETSLVLHRLNVDSSQISSCYQPRSDQPNNSAFSRPDNRPPTGFTTYEQKFLENKNQTSPNVVRLITTDETINELSDLCPLNY